ncbi:oligoribonuclease domain protein [Teladorsagia circumcincta]|uniref:Oligoribonuclease domain protein n=1 Tax=Teladorsagia circumcincta TaxID=45464 RepID=A0A2G9TTR7_TELCI|nr:oligoribonuclease domain protein [Teladorsagia circumcincta]
MYCVYRNFCHHMLSAVIRRMSQLAAREQRLVWIDCEMTGLNHEKQTLVEIATIVTDRDLNIVAEGPDIVIHQSEAVLRNMESWPRETFTENGLLKRIRESTVSMHEAEDMGIERAILKCYDLSRDQECLMWRNDVMVN